MFPYITLWGAKVQMTGIAIVIGFIFFLIISYYLIKKYHQNFRKFFYWLPILTIFVYILGKYVNFALNIGFFPKSINEILVLLSPYGYKFHLVGIIFGFLIAFNIFFKQIKRNENKKIWIDILFYGISLSLIPMGIFLLLGDNFIGKSCDFSICVKPLNIDSGLAKFNSVYPIGLFISIGSFITTFIIRTIKRKKKIFGLGIFGFILLIIVVNTIILMFQSYPKYGTISLGNIIFDIKQYISLVVIMILLYVNQKRNRN